MRVSFEKCINFTDDEYEKERETNLASHLSDPNSSTSNSMELLRITNEIIRVHSIIVESEHIRSTFLARRATALLVEILEPGDAVCACGD